MMEVQITALDGYKLAGSLFSPSANDRKQAVLINAAMGVKQNYYAGYAQFLAERGFTVLTYDYRGIGGSKPAKMRRFKAGYLDWAKNDQTGAIRWLLENYPGYPLLAVGHSLGGQILGLTPDYGCYTRCLNIASQSGYWKFWDGTDRLQMFLIWHLMIPTLARIVGYFPGSRVGMGQDIPAQVAIDWADAGSQPRYILDLYPENYFDKISAPMKFIGFSDDSYAPYRAVEGLMAFYSGASKSHDHITPQSIGADRIEHFGFFRPKFAATLWEQSAQWLEAV